MLNINKVTIRNFLSIGNVTQTILLNSVGLTLILGQNIDTESQVDRNGAGKSTILQAIIFALYGWPLTKIKIDNLVNNINNKNMLVTVDFEKNGIKYRIERGRKPTTMKFFVNDNERISDETKGKTSVTQIEIDNVIGMSFNMFRLIVALNTFNDPFLRMGAQAQRDTIEELLGVTQLSQKAESLKQLIDVTKKSINEEEILIKAIIEANRRIQITIDQTTQSRDKWIIDHEEKLASIQQEIEALATIDFTHELSLFDSIDEYYKQLNILNEEQRNLIREVGVIKSQINHNNSDITSKKRDLTHIQNGSTSRLEEEKSRKEKEKYRKNEQLQKYINDVSNLTNDLSKVDEQNCVCCGQSLQGTDHLQLVINNINAQISDYNNKIEFEKNELTSLILDIEHIDADIDNTLINNQQNKLRIEQDITIKQGIVDELQLELNKFNNQLLVVKNGINSLIKPRSSFASRDELYRARQVQESLDRDYIIESEQTNTYDDHLDNLYKTLQTIDYTKINELTMLQKHHDFLLRLLVNKDSFIRKKIVDQNLYYLNTRLNTYLVKLGLPHEVCFQSDMTVDITLLGRDFDYEQLSRGEMNRVILATSWAFRDVWESLNNSVNLLFVDELLDSGLSEQGSEAALAVLKDMVRTRNKNVFLISHKENLIGRIDNVMMITKEDGFTSIEVT